MIASGANDGQIQIWDQSRTVAPRIKIQNAHKPMLEISNVTFSYDNTCLSSRGADGSVKIWDLRNTKKVLVERTDLPSMYHCTQEQIQTPPDGPCDGRPCPDRAPTDILIGGSTIDYEHWSVTLEVST